MIALGHFKCDVKLHKCHEFIFLKHFLFYPSEKKKDGKEPSCFTTDAALLFRRLAKVLKKGQLHNFQT